MFKQLNRWLIAWPLVALLFVAGCGEEKYTGPESFGPGEVNPAMNEAFADANESVKKMVQDALVAFSKHCLLYTSPSPRDRQKSRMPSSA